MGSIATIINISRWCDQRLFRLNGTTSRVCSQEAMTHTTNDWLACPIVDLTTTCDNMIKFKNASEPPATQASPLTSGYCCPWCSTMLGEWVGSTYTHVTHDRYICTEMKIIKSAWPFFKMSYVPLYVYIKYQTYMNETSLLCIYLLSASLRRILYKRSI